VECFPMALANEQGGWAEVSKQRHPFHSGRRSEVDSEGKPVTPTGVSAPVTALGISSLRWLYPNKAYLQSLTSCFRATRHPAALAINEPTPDLKGKKRAVPEPEEEDEEGPSTKRHRTTRSTATRSAAMSPRKPKCVLLRSRCSCSFLIPCTEPAPRAAKPP